jgi:hypothetical protein
MRFAWITLAHLPLLLACSGSHGRGDETPGPSEDAGRRRRDAGPVGPADAGPPVLDAGMASCEPDDAHPILCPDLLCDGPPTWHWDGESCLAIECGACEGADCDRGSSSREICVATHAACDAALCLETGGTWKWWAEQCGHDICGQVPLESCLIGRPACACGPSSRFEPLVGCVHDGTCGIPEPGTPEQLCGWTGGTWGSFCCHTECGERCGDDCTSPACDCAGPREVFEPGRGCVESASCWSRTLGQSCDETTRCPASTLCCRTCSGAGCFDPSCRVPVCDGDEHTDICGNRDDVP